MRILIAGAGAIGSAVGGFLRRAGYDVALLGRDSHIKAIRENGLSIRGIFGDFVVNGFELFSSFEEISGNFDIIIISVKTYDTESMVKNVSGFLKEDGIMASFQNGLGNVEIIKSYVGESRTVGARVIFGVVFEDPGKIEITVWADSIMVGVPYLSNLTFEEARVIVDRSKKLVEMLNKSGLQAEYTKDIMSYIWSKLLYNAALNPLAAILDTKYGLLGELKETRDVMDNIVSEIFQVAFGKGVKLFWNKPSQFLEVFYSKLLPSTYDHIPSMLQDIKKGKRTEIDSMNGMICKYGEELNIPTPYNFSVTSMIKFLEYKNSLK